MSSAPEGTAAVKAAGNESATASEPAARGGSARRWLAGIGLFLLAFVLYWLCDLLLTKEIGVAASWIIVFAMAIFAHVVWIRDEKRQNAEDSATAESVSADPAVKTGGADANA